MGGDGPGGRAALGRRGVAPTEGWTRAWGLPGRLLWWLTGLYVARLDRVVLAPRSAVAAALAGRLRPGWTGDGELLVRWNGERGRAARSGRWHSALDTTTVARLTLDEAAGGARVRGTVRPALGYWLTWAGAVAYAVDVVLRHGGDVPGPLSGPFVVALIARVSIVAERPERLRAVIDEAAAVPVAATR